jgi:hypothetical protein
MWKWDMAQKIKLFTWLSIENKILTWDTLQRKGWEGPNICHLCSKDAESVYHLFVNCSFIQDVWNRIKRELNIMTAWEGSSLFGCYENWDRKESSFITLPSLLCWFVWLERNKKKFEGRNPSTLSVVFKIRENLALQTATLKKAIPRLVQIPSFTTPIVSWFDGAT